MFTAGFIESRRRAAHSLRCHDSQLLVQVVLRHVNVVTGNCHTESTDVAGVVLAERNVELDRRRRTRCIGNLVRTRDDRAGTSDRYIADRASDRERSL